LRYQSKSTLLVTSFGLPPFIFNISNTLLLGTLSYWSVFVNMSCKNRLNHVYIDVIGIHKRHFVPVSRLFTVSVHLKQLTTPFYRGLKIATATRPPSTTATKINNHPPQIPFPDAGVDSSAWAPRGLTVTGSDSV